MGVLKPGEKFWQHRIPTRIGHFSIPELAAYLGVTYHTVRNHLRKLGINLTPAVRHAWLKGGVPIRKQYKKNLRSLTPDEAARVIESVRAGEGRRMIRRAERGAEDGCFTDESDGSRETF